LGVSVNSARAGTSQGVLYETFGSGGVAGVSLSTPHVGIGALNDPATNIVSAGGNIYFESGTTVYETSANLQGLSVVDSLPTVAPSGFAVDAADGILYESFGQGGIDAISIANPHFAFGGLNIDATNVVYAGGNVYFQSGNTIYESSNTLHGLTVIDPLPSLAPTGFAVDAADGILYEAFGQGGVAAINIANPHMSFGFLNIDATNVVYAGGNVYFQSGNTIYESSNTLQGLNVVFSLNTLPPSDFTVAFAPASVPEPSTIVMLATGLMVLVRAHGRSRSRQARQFDSPEFRLEKVRLGSG
jgi:hypothetical protein